MESTRTLRSPSAPEDGRRQPRYRLLPTLGLVGGGLLGLVDALWFSSFESTVRFGGRDLQPAVVVGFTLNLALFGYLLGRLLVARAQAQADRRTIAEQHDALVRSQESLVQQEKLAALGRLVASIAHELRNPLGVIRSAAGILTESTAPDADPRLRRSAELVVEEVDHMNATITALLAFARPARLELEDVELERVLERALHLTEETAGRVEIDRRLPGGPLTVVGDLHLLTQLVAGLLANAVEAVDAESGRVELRAYRTGDTVRVEVADNGPGIDEDEAVRVFEPFFTTKADGTGLGLAVAHRIADAHGGRLEVIEGAGAGPGGACLRLTLPVDREAAP